MYYKFIKMKDNFLTYEQSLAVKELGFNEPCFGWYHSRFNTLEIEIVNSINIGNSIYAPLKSQFFKWARDKKLSDSCVYRYQSIDDGGVYYYYVINHDYGVKETKHYKEGFYSYEEAEDACINKIIEIIKT